MSNKNEDVVIGGDQTKNESTESNIKDGKFDENELDEYVTPQNRIIPEIVNALRSNDRTARLIAATKLHRLVDKRETTAIQAIIDSGIVCDIVNMVSLDDVDLHRHLNAVLSNMVAGSSEQTSAVVEQGAIPKFILIAFSSPSDHARLDALFALADIGADSRDLRDKVIEEGALEPLLEILDNPSEYQGRHIVYGAANAIQRITYSLQPGSAGYRMIWDILPVLTGYIKSQTIETSRSLEASLLALKSILSVKSTIEDVLHSRIVPRLVQLCTAKHAPTRRPALRCVGSILAGSKHGTNHLVDAGIIEAIRPCITAEDRLERRDACWAAANIAVGTFEQAKALVAAGFVTPLVHIVSNTEEASVTRGNAAWALAYLTYDLGNESEILETLLQAACLDGLLSALKLEERDVIKASLKGIKVFVTSRWNGKQRAIEMLKTGNGVTLLRAFKLRPESDLVKERLIVHKILKEHLGEFSLPPRV